MLCVAEKEKRRVRAHGLQSFQRFCDRFVGRVPRPGAFFHTFIATLEIQPSLRDGNTCLGLPPALKGRAKIIGADAAVYRQRNL
jgi:hypothetical protein